MSARQIPLFFSLILGLSIVACIDKGDQPVSSLQPGSAPSTYAYRAYNAKGDLAVSGTLTLSVADTTSVTGTWSCVAVLPSEKVGPQVGTGGLRGTIQNSSISIDMNPGWADNNVFLQGTFSSNRITGRWMWSTFTGPTAEGAFEATLVATTQKTFN